MSSNHTRIYLASQSPRRRELLKQIGVHFDPLLLRNDSRREVRVDETPLADELPVDYVQRICHAKAEAGWEALLLRKLRTYPVLAADTTVTVNGKIIGKPDNNEHAFQILSELSGTRHQVLTAVAVAFEGRVEMRLSTTHITFAELDETRIRRYLLTGEAHDKAGAYGIQGAAGAFVKHIDGSYTAVMGLPLFETIELLQSFGVSTS
ncbi:MAG: septum formation inhibitor Maf [Gammaproteobacteria bacterium]|nr:septum formation inhibitor Maf [Gammaproteobacteria bacterium]MBU1624139.1 septum formation inhibitor Maf [Gammaproteobacteria bacterium]MBU1981867.1 septum formation inhibitor Maf [Gammaproteobacteria bacterium]